MERERGDEALCSVWGVGVGGRTCFLCLVQHKDAEDGDLRQKHDASEAVGPSSEAKEKRVESLREREGRGAGGGRKITHPSVCIESDKVQIPQGSRCDASE